MAAFEDSGIIKDEDIKNLRTLLDMGDAIAPTWFHTLRTAIGLSSDDPNMIRLLEFLSWPGDATEDGGQAEFWKGQIRLCLFVNR